MLFFEYIQSRLCIVSGPSVEIKKYIDNWDSNKNLVLVTHYVVISEALDYASRSGEIVISDRNFKIKSNIIIDY